MKTKIIYICGGETCDISDIRSAFNQVKSTLGLDKETILFGVPIDTELEDIKLEKTFDKDETSLEESFEDEKDSEINEISEYKDLEEEKVIPILSVLSSKNEKENDNKNEEVQEEVIEIEEFDEINDESEIESEEVITEITEEIEEKSEEPDLKEESYSDEEISTTSIDELFKTVPSLDEFSENDNIDFIVDDLDNSQEDNITTDKVIELLTKEYMEKQKEIELSEEPKNKKGLLSGFKKAKKKQPTFDLFRWAGFPANEEDYTRPSIDDK